MALQPHLVLLVLFAAVVHAGWNAVVKTSGDRFLTFTTIHATGMVVGLAVLPLVPALKAEAWPYVVASALVHNGYYVFLLWAYRMGDLSQVYPIARGTAPLLVTLFAAWFAREVPPPLGLAGIAVASAGIAGLAFAGRRPDSRFWAACGPALGTALFIAGYTVIDGVGIRRAGSPYSYIVWLNVLEAVPFALWAATVRRRDMVPYLRRHWGPGVTGGVLSILAYGCALYALSQAPMAYVAALRETSVVFAAVIGAVMLKETFGRPRIALAAAVAAGIALLQASG